MPDKARRKGVHGRPRRRKAADGRVRKVHRKGKRKPQPRAAQSAVTVIVTFKGIRREFKFLDNPQVKIEEKFASYADLLGDGARRMRWAGPAFCTMHIEGILS